MTDIENDPVGAFDELRREISVLVRAFQGLAAQHDKLPDYTETLKAIDDKLGAVAATQVAIVERPAMQLTPRSLAVELDEASRIARAKESELLRSAHALGDNLTTELRRSLAQVHTARLQRQHVIWATAAGVMSGILLWAALPGFVVRALPANWGAPEWMAARVMRADKATAANRMLRQSTSEAKTEAVEPRVAPQHTDVGRKQPLPRKRH